MLRRVIFTWKREEGLISVSSMITNKLKNNHGASLVFAVVVFMVITLFCISILSSGLETISGADTVNSIEQSYMAVSSAARLLQSIIPNNEANKLIQVIHYREPTDQECLNGFDQNDLYSETTFNRSNTRSMDHALLDMIEMVYGLRLNGVTSQTVSYTTSFVYAIPDIPNVDSTLKMTKRNLTAKFETAGNERIPEYNLTLTFRTVKSDVETVTNSKTVWVQEGVDDEGNPIMVEYGPFVYKVTDKLSYYWVPEHTS